MEDNYVYLVWHDGSGDPSDDESGFTPWGVYGTREAAETAYGQMRATAVPYETDGEKGTFYPDGHMVKIRVADEPTGEVWYQQATMLRLGRYNVETKEFDLESNRR